MNDKSPTARPKRGGRKPMPALRNQRHELFAQALAKGSPASKAYVEAGYQANDSNAARLNGDERVSARVSELLGAAAERAVVSIESICRELDAVEADARNDKQHSARVASIMGEAKVCGLLKDKIETSGPVIVEILRLSDDDDTRDRGLAPPIWEK